MKTLLVIGGLPILVAAAVFGARWLRAYLRLRGARVVRCPETGRPAAVEADARGGALRAVLGDASPSLRDCSRWPERSGCGQECLAEIERAPEGCLVRKRLEDWYRSRVCEICSRPFGTLHWHDHRPALLDAGGKTHEWREIAPEQVPDTLLSHRPVCWDCHVAATFRRRFPQLVTDRERERRAP